jgi:hypothetical protein
MPILVIKSMDVLKWSIGLAVVALAIAPAGCSPEGTGSIKIENPQTVREKFERPADSKAKAGSKQTKALEAEQEAAKKHPKLR